MHERPAGARSPKATSLRSVVSRLRLARRDRTHDTSHPV